MSGRTADERADEVVRALMRSQHEASVLRADLTSARKRLEKLEARYFAADEERAKLGPRCDKAEEELAALRREHEALFRAGFALPAEDAGLEDVVQEWLASARELDAVVAKEREAAGKGDPGFDVVLLETRATVLRECAARLQRYLRAQGGKA